MTTPTVEPSVVEKAILAIVTTVVVALLAWLGTTQLETLRQMAIVTTKLEYLQDASKNWYTASDASADRRTSDLRQAELERRVQLLEENRRLH
jgi:hypothetical protein